MGDFDGFDVESLKVFINEAESGMKSMSDLISSFEEFKENIEACKRKKFTEIVNKMNKNVAIFAECLDNMLGCINNDI